MNIQCYLFTFAVFVHSGQVEYNGSRSYSKRKEFLQGVHSSIHQHQSQLSFNEKSSASLCAQQPLLTFVYRKKLEQPNKVL